MSISTEIARLQQAKADLKTAIEAKGVTVPAATTLDGYAALVDSIGGTPPYDAEIEYLGFSGTQYINLDYWTGKKLEVHTTVSINTVANTEQDIIGNQCGANDTKRRFILCVYNSKLTIVSRNNTGDNLAFTSNYAANTFYTVKMLLSPDDNKRQLTVDGSSVSSGLNYSVDNSWAVLRIGAGYASGGSLNPNYYFSGKIKKMTVMGDNVARYDFIPVRVGQVGYLYDRISGTLHGNDGTGSFVLGNDVT